MRKKVFWIVLLIPFLAFCLTSCWSAPGQGRKAEAGYRDAAPVIAALEKFHHDRGIYPATLNELVPQYLPSAALLNHGGKQPVRPPRTAAFVSGWDNRYRFGYYRDKNASAYSLQFSYTGPGMNHCWYDSKTKQWTAQGYY
jgi:hypothetical protein